jgi:hippurate hydrolase
MTVTVASFSTDNADFVAFRRDLHQNPELSFDEHRTAGLVADKLQEWGYTVDLSLGGTGVVAKLVKGQGKRHLGIRADMDALPIQETGVAAWASRKMGVMHACGHDGHTTMLLAAAKHIAEKVDFDGTLTLIFQPAEEVGSSKGGAARMIEEGLFDKYPCDAVYAMHNAPTIPQGVLLMRPGPAMASTDQAHIVLTGVGGHGAMPQFAVDPTVAAASFVMALQTVVSRNVDPQATAVVSVGVLQAGTASNVIPGTARIELSIRALEPAVRDLLQRRITELAHDHAKSFGVQAEVNYIRGCPPTVNTPEEAAFAHQVALELLGPQRVVFPCPAATGSEDFAFMLERKPGCYVLIGNGLAGTPNGCMVHNPGYDFNDDNIAVGAAFWALLTQRYLVK